MILMIDNWQLVCWPKLYIFIKDQYIKEHVDDERMRQSQCK